MPDTSASSVRIRELTAQRNAVIDATEQLHVDIERAFDAYRERIAWVSGALKRERGGDKVTSNGRRKIE